MKSLSLRLLSLNKIKIGLYSALKMLAVNRQFIGARLRTHLKLII